MLPNKTHPLFSKEFPAIALYRGHKALRVEQVYIKETLPNGKPWTIVYISRWTMSFWERLKSLFTGCIYVIVAYNPNIKDSAPIHTLVSFIEPKMHKQYPFEDINKAMVKQRELIK